MTSTLTIADYSEFQGVVHPPSSQVVIIRAHNGWRPDFDFAANRAAAHAAKCPAVGLYQYLPASVDPVQAANDLLSTIGSLATDEWLICDLEEGTGDQQPRWQAWRAQVETVTKRTPWLYTGLDFAQAHDLDPDWLADYNASLPAGTPPHKLWQDTDAYAWPWGHSDASVFDGNLPEFLQAAGISLPSVPTSAPKAPAPSPASPTSKKGRSVNRFLLRAVNKASATVQPGSWWIIDFDDPAHITRTLVAADQLAAINTIFASLGLLASVDCDQIEGFPVA